MMDLIKEATIDLNKWTKKKENNLLPLPSWRYFVRPWSVAKTEIRKVQEYLMQA